MKKLERVLVAVDFSEPARAAFDHALALSRRHGAELLAVHAVPSDTPFKWHGRERLELVGRLGAAAREAGVPFVVSIQSGDPAEVIVLHANARRADLIVLGSSKRSGLDRFRVGSVAETVVLEAAQPVLVVPESEAGVAASPPFKSILVAVDLGDGSRAAVERALSMGDEHTRVTVAHVLPGVPLAGAHRYMYHLGEPEYQRQLARDAWEKIPAIVPPTSRQVHVRVVVGDLSTGISRVARESDADVILVGVTRRGTIGRLFIGSTAVRVIRAAGVAVLAMPQHQPVPSLPDEGGLAVAA